MMNPAGNKPPMIDKSTFYADAPQPTPEQNAYFKLNNWNGQYANAAINNMPFVLDPGMMFGKDRAQMKELMYQPKPQAEGDAAMQQPASPTGTPAEQMLGLLQANPELLPIIMQQMQQGQQNITPGNQGP
jgi:hypothetical protein